MGIERLRRSRRYGRTANLTTFQGGGHLNQAPADNLFHEHISKQRQFAQFFPRNGCDNDE